MYELIVLGQIPGTDLVITFSWFVAIATIAGGFAMLRSTHKHHDHAHQTNIKDTTL